ncbi:flagellar filament capping protein FliD [Clostridium sp. WILCCON 0269]|uniref:Flagellar hook-associated protein 2 n=1 Tax=Candidatus Clostridium eludens TaxID=3381663 RepID=A0ABW8SPH6_9CLOT
MTTINSSSSTSSATTSTYNSGSTMRITGMATGLDVDSLVKAMLTSDQTKIDTAKQAQQTAQWKQEAYQSIITDIKSLQSTYFDITNSTNCLTTSSNYNSLTASSTEGSIATATTNSTAVQGTYNVTVGAIAKSATMPSSKIIASQVQLNDGWSGKTIALSDGNSSDNESITIDSSFSGSIDDLVTSLNTKLQATTNYTDLTVSNDNGKLKFTNGSTSNAITIDGSSIPDIGTTKTVAANNGTYETSGFDNSILSGWSGKSISFDINGDTTNPVTITIPSTGISSASDLVSSINNQISSQSKLSGLSASLITDGSTNYIKFNVSSSSTSTIAIDSSNTTVSGLSSISSISSSSSNIKLTSLDSSLNSSLVLNLKYDGNDVAVTLDNTKGGATINSLLQAINTATGGKVTGKIDDTTGKLTLQTSDTGSIASLEIEDTYTKSDGTTSAATTSALLTALGLSSGTTAKGTDATVTITEPGGTAKTLTETSNSFTINGVNYNLVSAGTTSLSVTSDTQAIYDKISGFLDKYNSLVSEIYTKLTEKKDYDYPPLTDAQKSGMTDTQITAWETKAKTGILANDSNLENLLTDLTSAFTMPVTASGSNISSLAFGNYGSSSIGIDTSNDVTDGGQVTIQDATKLKAAIANNPDQLIKLFTNSPGSTVTDTTEKFNESGIFQRISTILTNNVGVTGTTLNNAILTQYANLQDDYSATGGSGTGTIPDQIYDQQLLITQYTDKYNTDQTNYYNKYSQLESLITQMNAQQSAISSMLSSG